MSSAALRNKFPISQEEFLIHEMTTCRLLRYSTQTETRSIFRKRIYSSVRWRFVDYYGTRLKLRQDLYFPRGFIHPWGDNSSTTTVLDSRWDKISTSQEDLVIHEVTTHQLLRYSTQDETISLFSKRTYSSMRWQFVDYYDSRFWENTRLLIPKGNSSSIRRQLIDYHSTCQTRDSRTAHKHRMI